MTDKARNSHVGQLAAVVVTHDRLTDLKKTVSRLLSTQKDLLECIVIIDNASGDGTREWLDTQNDPRLIKRRTDDNIGGAGGFEFGMRIAEETSNPDWFVLMDDDSRPLPDAICRFHNSPRDSSSAWAAAVYFPDGEICEMNRPSRNPFWNRKAFFQTLMGRGRNGYHIDYTAYETDNPIPVDMASFVGMFLSRDVVDKIGYPDGSLFIYGDDVIYSLTLRQNGLTITFDPALRFEHDCKTFENDQVRIFRPMWKMYYAYRNGLIMYRRAAGPMFWPLLLVLLPKWIIAVRHFGGRRFSYLRLLRLAFWHGTRGYTGARHSDIVDFAR